MRGLRSRTQGMVKSRLLAPVASALLIAAALALFLLFLESSDTALFFTHPHANSSVVSRAVDLPWGCQRYTKRGLCIPEALAAFDAAYEPYWPGSVDALIRSYFSPRFFLLGVLFQSMEQMWPRNIGRVILVLDEGDDPAVHLVPDWVEVKFERNYLNLPGKFLQQWSYGWADNYTSAPYIAIFDDDTVLNLKVTPPLLFNLSTGRPYMIGSKEQGYYKENTLYFLGRHTYGANFMVSLPFVQPRSILPGYRQKIAQVHPDKQGYDGAFKWLADNGGEYKDKLAHTIVGNYIYKWEADTVDVALEWTDHAPIPRVGVHVPYTNMFKELGGVPREDMLNTSFLSTSLHYMREAMCFSFPKGEVGGCEDLAEQRHIWRYCWDRELWRAIKKGRRNAKDVYWKHLQELHCMYDVLVERNTSGRAAAVVAAAAAAAAELRQRCLGGLRH